MGKRISEYTALSSVASGDELVIVDKSDTSQAESGSTKKITRANLIDGLALTSALTSHTSDTDNPHGVTKTQVSLGNVTNVEQLPLSYLDTDGTLAANSDTKVASQKASKTYVLTGYRFLKRTIYTSGSGTFAKDSKTRILFVTGVGGGAGAGGADRNAGPQPAAGAGGGAGGTFQKLITSPGDTYAYAVGAAGSGGGAGATGNNGGNTTFGTALLTANGGSGGAGMSPNTTVLVVTGGTGGTASGGDINFTGQSGGVGIRFDSASLIAGRGGNTPFGTGGREVGSVSTSIAPSDATGYGSGGGGGIASGSDQGGGAGAGGLIIVDEYI